MNLPPGTTDQHIAQRFGDGPADCEACEGKGKNFRSNCCDAPFMGHGWPDNDFCSSCHDHAEPYSCDDCDGTGKQPKSEPPEE